MDVESLSIDEKTELLKRIVDSTEVIVEGSYNTSDEITMDDVYCEGGTIRIDARINI